MLKKLLGPASKSYPNMHPKATAMASYGHSRLPFARPQTLKTLQTPKTKPLKNSCHAQPRRQKLPEQALQKATAMASYRKHGCSNSLYGRSRLPFARPQTLKTLTPLQKLLPRPTPQAKATPAGTPRPQQ